MKNFFYQMIFTIILFCLINKTYQVFYVLDPHENRCITKHVNAATVFSGNYYFSGESELENSVYIRNPEQNTIWSDKGHTSGSFNFDVTNSGKVKSLNCSNK